MEEETGRVAVSDAEPGTDCPPPDPNPNPHARPPPVPGLGPRPFSLGDASLARRAESEVARWLQRFQPYPHLPFPFQTPIPNLDLGFKDDLGGGVHPCPPNNTLATEGRAPNLPRHSRSPIPNLDLESHDLAQPSLRPNLGRGFRRSTPRYPVPAERRAAWRPQQFQWNPNLPSHLRVPNPNPDLESHGSEQPPQRPDLGRGLRPPLPGVLPGFGVGKLAAWRKTLRLWGQTLKHESRIEAAR
ncbi:hypothetical protein MUK42_16888 [Musa troglodytarum]|uniref:Uncharacterized protein n=1 Tax=Musa troglodytarum TaxID=320322 RepID=A0A9E7H9I3_9LILI|nr:hypothetical protein MUK42_16888 [Musa troglodytarum]